MKSIKNFLILLVLVWVSEGIAQKSEEFDVTFEQDVTVEGRFEASSTTKPNKPCSSFTEAQRDALSAVAGDCVYNTTTNQLNIFDGVDWASAGGGGIANWITAFSYKEDNVVIESNKIYQALVDHTSGTFATDLASGKWVQLQPLGPNASVDGEVALFDGVGGDKLKRATGTGFAKLSSGVLSTSGTVDASTEVSGVLPMANGGTDKNLTPTLGGVVYTDANSMEVLAAGTSGQVLKSNGAAAPTWQNASNKIEGLEQTESEFNKVQFKNKSVTETAAGVQLVETERSLLANGSFEHLSYQSSWTITGSATISRETSIVRDGKVSLKAVTTGNSFRIEQTTTQLSGTNVSAYAVVWVNNTAAGVQICSMLAGSDKDCVTALTDGKWQSYIIPMVLGATSNGISVHSGTTAGTTYVDWVRLVDEDLVGTSPVIEVQSSRRDFGSSATPVTVTGTLNQTFGQGIYSYNSGTGVYTVLKDGIFNISASSSASITQTNISINISGQPSLRDSSNYDASTSAWSGRLTSGQTFSVSLTGGGTSAAVTVSVVGTYTGTMPSYSSPNSTASLRAGQIITGAFSACPQNTLEADGRQVLRNEYPQLFSAIGIAHGQGDGSTTFNLPDYRGQFLRGRIAIANATGTGSAASNQATFTNHGFNRTGLRVRLASGTLSGLAASTNYYVIVVDANTLAFATTRANALANTRIAISGTNTAVIQQWEDVDASTRLASNVGGNTGTNVGSIQEDALQNITAYFSSASDVSILRGGDSASGALAIAGGGRSYIRGYQSAGAGNGDLSFDASRVARTSNETRPSNVYVRYCIQAIDTYIVGSFRDYNKTEGTASGRVDTFSFAYSANSSFSASCTASSCFVDQIGDHVNSVTNSSNYYTATFKRTYAKLRCSATTTNTATRVTVPTSIGAVGAPLSCNNCATISWESVDFTSNRNATSGTFVCQGTY